MAVIPKLKILVYGDPGSGKTYFAGTFGQCEDTSPALVLNSRGQPVTFNLFPNDMPLIYDVRTMKDYNLPYEWIKNGQPWDVLMANQGQPFFQAVYDYFVPPADVAAPGEDGVFETDERKFRTVVLDSLTHAQRISIREISGDQGKLPGDIPKAVGFKEWGKTLGQLTLLADLYYELPVHVLITALRKHQYNEAQGMTMYYPFFWGQSAHEVPSYAEIVGMLVNIDSLPVQQAMAAKEQGSQDASGEAPFNVLILQGGRSHRAKWQGVRNPPAVVVNPTATKMLNVVCGVPLDWGAQPSVS